MSTGSHGSGSPRRLLSQIDLFQVFHELHKSFHRLLFPFTETVVEAGQEVAGLRIGQADPAAV